MYMTSTILNVYYLFPQHGTQCGKKLYKISKQAFTLIQLYRSERTQQQNITTRRKQKYAKQKAAFSKEFSVQPRLAFQKTKNKTNKKQMPPL